MLNDINQKTSSRKKQKTLDNIILIIIFIVLIIIIYLGVFGSKEINQSPDSPKHVQDAAVAVNNVTPHAPPAQDVQLQSGTDKVKKAKWGNSEFGL